MCYDSAVPGDWDFLAALKIARARIAASAGKDVSEVETFEGEHITRTRNYLTMAAPALAQLQMALTLGTDPEELDRIRGGARLILESIKQAHAVVGLRAGEEVSMDLSERMQTFLTRWQDRQALVSGDAEPVVIEAEAQEPVRRISG